MVGGGWWGEDGRGRMVGGGWYGEDGPCIVNGDFG